MRQLARIFSCEASDEETDDIESSDALQQLVNTDGRRTGGDPRRVAGAQLGILG